MFRTSLTSFLVIVAVALTAACKKDSADTARATGDTRAATRTADTRATGDDHWGPNCRAYFAAVAEACKPPHDQSSACKSWTTGVQSMKERPKDDPKNAEAEKVGCKMMIGMVQRAIADRK
ncbi:MAG: hypothetical protein HYY84_04665 [Deltaproteobacteria bacterium]|nr:hypothetical protein [Deltaproteobacteria bacterium]